MFAYCENNTVSRVDPTGHFWSEIWEFAKTAVTEIGKAIGVLSPAYAGCGGAAVADGPLPIGDIIGAAGAILLTVGAIGYGIYQATQAPSISIPKAEEKEKDIAAPPPSPTVIYRYGGTNPRREKTKKNMVIFLYDTKTRCSCDYDRSFKLCRSRWSNTCQCKTYRWNNG